MRSQTLVHGQRANWALEPGHKPHAFGNLYPELTMIRTSEARNGIMETFIHSFIKEFVEMERGMYGNKDSD